MSRLAGRLLQLRLPLLLALAAWASLLALESWIRPAGIPGAGGGQALPQRLERSGRVYERLPASLPPTAPRRPLPEGVQILGGADYRAVDPAAPSGGPGSGLILLRRVAHGRTGRSGLLPVEAITAALAGPAGRGRCVWLDAEGGVIAAAASQNALGEALRARPVPLVERLAWLAGLRPFRDNSCLWEGSPAP
jgi:hypothetical protein